MHQRHFFSYQVRVPEFSYFPIPITEYNSITVVILLITINKLGTEVK